MPEKGVIPQNVGLEFRESVLYWRQCEETLDRMLVILGFAMPDQLFPMKLFSTAMVGEASEMWRQRDGRGREMAEMERQRGIPHSAIILPFCHICHSPIPCFIQYIIS